MRKFKKALAFALASAMIVSAVPASAAAKTNSAKGTKSTIYTYTVDKSKKANANNKRSWIKVTAKKGYTYKLVNKTKNLVSLTKTRVEAKKTGTAKINVNFYKNGKYVETKSVKITVKKAPMIGKVTLDKSEITAGETTKVSNAGKGTAYFYSSNKDVATVDKKTGEITAKAAGTTTISAVNTITKARVYLTLTVNAQFGAKQTGAKTITVTGNGFTTESKIAITKGNQTVTFDAKNVKISSDGKTMEIVTNSNIMDAEYKVVVDSKEATFKGEASKVTTIESGEVAIAKKGTTLPYTNTATSGAAIVRYTVKNQFGEDITKTTPVSVSSNRLKSNPTTTTGEIELNVVNGDKEGDLIPIVIIETKTATTLSKSVKLSAQSAITEFSVNGLYNKDGKTYSEDTAKTDDFYVLLNAKDQYGNDIKAADFNLTDGTDVIVSVIPSLTNFDKVLDKSCTVENLTVNGVQYIAVKLKRSDSVNTVKSGTATVMFISKHSGQVAQGTVTVADGVKVDKLTITPSDIVLAGQKNRFEFSATDTYGNAVEDINVLNKMDLPTTDNGAGKFRFVKDTKTGKPYLEYDATNSAVTTGIKAVVFISATNQPVTVQFNVQDAAKATTIVGIKDVATGVLTNQTITLTGSSIKFEDQYGQELTKTVNTGLSYELEGGDGVFKETSEGVFQAQKSGNQKVTITYKEGDKVVSTYVATLSAREIDELGSFKVEAKNMAKVTAAADATDIASKLTVTGTASDGTAITLPSSAYTAYVNGNNASAVSGSALGFTDNKKETKDVNVSVIIANKAGTEVKTTVKASNTASVPTTVTLKDTAKITNTTAFTMRDAVDALKVEDQYGDDITAATTARVKFSGFSDKATVNNNNTKSASITVNDSNISTITVDYTFDNGVTFTASIVVE